MPNDSDQPDKDRPEDELARIFAPPTDSAATPPPQPPPPPYGWPQAGYPGYPGYPGQPGWPGMAPPFREWSGYAITSLVLGILGFACCLWAAGIGFGIAALRTIPQRNQRGRGMAVAGLVLSAMWALLLVLGIAVGALGHGLDSRLPVDPSSAEPTAPQEAVSVFLLQRGDCFDKLDDRMSAATVRLVPCSERHYGEVFAFEAIPGSAFPGDQQVSAQAEKGCQRSLPDYVLDTLALPSTVEVRYFAPTEKTWYDPKHHSATCILVDTSGGRTGTLQRDESSLTPQQLAYLKAAEHFDTDVAEVPDGSVAQDPAAFRDWAGRTAISADAEVTALGARPWDDRTKQPVADLTAQLRQAIRHLQAAKQAPDSDTLAREIAEAQRHTGDREAMAVRAALGLATGPVDGGGGDFPSPAPSPSSSAGALGV